MITIDLEPIVPDAIMAIGDQSVLDAIVGSIAEGARSEWIRLAQSILNQTQLDYVNGIQPVAFEQGAAVITLVGAFPNYLENGGPGYDMRATLLGPNVPVVPEGQRGKHATKDGTGYWRIIPMRHSVGQKGAGFGKPYSAIMPAEDAAKMGQSIYQKAKRLKGTTSEPGQGSKWGGRLPAGLAPKLREHHKVDIFAGMVRQSKTYEKATQSQYTTFRIISTKQTEGWLQPARQGLHLAERVENYIHMIAPQSFEAFLKAATGAT